MIQNDTEFQATQYRLAQVEKVVCGLVMSSRREPLPIAYKGIYLRSNACERRSTNISYAPSKSPPLLPTKRHRSLSSRLADSARPLLLQETVALLLACVQPEVPGRMAHYTVLEEVSCHTNIRFPKGTLRRKSLG